MIIDNAEGLVFRPPSEAYSFILRATIGCSHNQCTFCAMYKDSKFRIRRLDEIKGIIDRGSRVYPTVRRLFIADGDALILPTDMLLSIIDYCYASFPRLTRIGAYATPRDLLRKTPEELKSSINEVLASSIWESKAAMMAYCDTSKKASQQTKLSKPVKKPSLQDSSCPV